MVMTTEVLRNMLYASSRTLLGLGFVVMDEVHYLADRDRGAVWEEIIIHLPESVSLVSLSATVSNAEEFGEWLDTVRGGGVTTIVEERRPVPLYQHVMVGKRLLDLFASSDVDAAAGFVKEGSAGQPRARARRPGRLGQQPDARPPLPAQPLADPWREGWSGRSEAGRQRSAGLDPQPGRRHRPARPRGTAAGDRVRLQPGRVRRRGVAVPVGQRPADLAGGARRDLRVRRDRLPLPPRRGPARARLPRLPRRPDPRRGRAPRRHAPGVQADRGAALRAGPVQGGLRDRDARARHQHAGPHGRDREAVEVERRDPRRPLAGGVHPAHGPGRPSRARRRGPRRRAVATRAEPP